MQSEKKMLSLFFEKCKVKSKCFHSFSRSEKWNQNASRSRSRSENSREFLTILEKRDFWTDLFRASQIRLLKQVACSWGNNHEQLNNFPLFSQAPQLGEVVHLGSAPVHHQHPLDNAWLRFKLSKRFFQEVRRTALSCSRRRGRDVSDWWREIWKQGPEKYT